MSLTRRSLPEGFDHLSDEQPVVQPVVAQPPQWIAAQVDASTLDVALNAAPDTSYAPQGTPKSKEQTNGSMLPNWRIVRIVNSLIDSAAGYDENILDSYGTPTDHKRRRNIGRAILVATAVGSLGWFAKIAGAYPGWMAIPVGLIVGVLYAVLSYSLESFFACNVDPYATKTSKSLSLFGRVMLSAVIAFAGALPWVTVSLKGAIEMEMSRISMEEQSSLRKGLDDAYGISAADSKSAAIKADMEKAASSLATLPPAIQLMVDSAESCSKELAVAKESADKKDRDLSARLASLERSEASGANASSEKGQIRRSLNKVNEDIATRKADCTSKKSIAEKARADHISFATQQRDTYQADLAKIRTEGSAVSGKLGVEKERIDALVERTARGNSSAEMAALLRVIETQTYAKVLAGMIFLGLLLVDCLPLTLRLFSRPGAYDLEKRADDRIRRMQAEGRWMQANVLHEARRDEISSAEFQRQVKAECQPHIRSVVLNSVEGFIKSSARA